MTHGLWGCRSPPRGTAIFDEAYDAGVFADGIKYQNHVWGFRLPTPNGPKRFRLRSGVTALVGLNGSGKTMALAGIEEALTGEQGVDTRLASLNNATYDNLQETRAYGGFLVFNEERDASDAPYVDSDYPLVFWAPSDPQVPFLASLIGKRREGVSSDELLGEYESLSEDLSDLLETRQISRISDFSPPASDPFSLEKIVEAPFWTTRYIGDVQRVGFAISWHVSPVIDVIEDLREIIAGWQNVFDEFGLEHFGGELILFNYHPLEMISDPGLAESIVLDPLGDSIPGELIEDLGNRSAVFEERATNNSLFNSYSWSSSVEPASSPYEAFQLVDGDIPEWCPFIAAELPAPTVGLPGDLRSTFYGWWQNQIEVVRAKFSVNWSELALTAQRALLDEINLIEEAVVLDDEGFPQERGGGRYSGIEVYLPQRHKAFVDRANRIFEKLMLDPPRFSGIPDIEIWIQDPTSIFFSLIEEELHLSSDTTQRWAAVAIRLALAGHDRDTLLLIDEPERGLGQLAQQHLAEGLRELSQDSRTTTILATHSAVMIGQPDTNVVSMPNFNSVETFAREELELMGFGAAEILAFYRITVLVEGHHEEVILNEIIGNELAEARARILPYRGTKNLSPATLESLFDFSTTNFVVTADRTRTTLFNKALEIGKANSSRRVAIDEIEELLKDLSQEEQALKSLLLKMVNSRDVDRLYRVVGLEQDDILDCLPVEEFTDAGSWADLRAAHQQAKDEKVRNTPNDFKAWLTRKHKVDFSDEKIRSAVGQLDALPDFVAELLDAIA